MWDAHVDRAPAIALTGQVQTQVFGPGAFQDIDLASAFAAVSTFSQTVLPSSKHAELMSLACKTALVEQNVAHLIFPDDIQTDPSEAPAGTPDGRMGRVDIQPTPTDVAAAVNLLNGAKRPLIIVGHGLAHGARDRISALAEKMGAAVVTTFKAKGLVTDAHPLGAACLAGRARPSPAGS